MNTYTATDKYKSVGVKSGVEGASSHQLVSMLLTGAITKIGEAKAGLAGGEIAIKCEAISKAIAIIEYLRASLDQGIDADFAEQLAELYLYMERRLLEANLHNEEAFLDEVRGLLRQVSEGWAGIPQEYRH